MENGEQNEKNGLINSQKNLYLKFKKINRLFMVHFLSLVIYFLFALGFMIIWISHLSIGQFTPDLIEVYGSFGIPWTIMLSLGTLIILILIGYQIYIYGVFLIRGIHFLKQVNGEERTCSPLYSGLVPYINNFYKFFDRFSKKRANLVNLVKTFLYLNFLSGSLAIVFITRLLDQLSDAEGVDSSLIFYMAILFLAIVTFWLITVLTSFKVNREVSKWQNLFPKLEDWARELENLSTGSLDRGGPPI